MISWRPILLISLVLSLPARVQAQSVQQSGQVTPGHTAMWVTSGVVKDAGPATAGNLTELGISRNGGLPFCISSDPNPANPRVQLCEGVSLNGNGFISLNSYNGAAQVPFDFIINGVTYPFGGTGFLSALFDQQFGSTPGELLCRGASGWVALPAASAGQVLQTQGATGCPQWASSTVITTPALRVVPSGSSDTASTTDNSILWNSATGSNKSQGISGCSSGLKGKTYIISDEIGTSSTFPIIVTPASGTVANRPTFAIQGDGSSNSFQCDGISNWIAW